MKQIQLKLKKILHQKVTYFENNKFKNDPNYDDPLARRKKPRKLNNSNELNNSNNSLSSTSPSSSTITTSSSSTSVTTDSGNLIFKT